MTLAHIPKIVGQLRATAKNDRANVKEKCYNGGTQSKINVTTIVNVIFFMISSPLILFLH